MRSYIHFSGLLTEEDESSSRHKRSIVSLLQVNEDLQSVTLSFKIDYKQIYDVMFNQQHLCASNCSKYSPERVLPPCYEEISAGSMLQSYTDV